MFIAYKLKKTNNKKKTPLQNLQGRKQTGGWRRSKEQKKCEQNPF